MNKKKRVLSLVMALVMALGVLAVMPMTANAAGTFDYRTSLTTENTGDVYDYSSRELNKLVANAPVQDGVINEGEYTLKESGKSTRAHAAPTSLPDERYLAQDDEYIYVGLYLRYYLATSKGSFFLFPLQEFDNASASCQDYECLYFNFNANSTSMICAGVASPSTDTDITTHVSNGFSQASTYSGKLTTTANGGAYIEAKFSKAALAASAGVDVEDFINFRYMFRYYVSDKPTSATWVGWQFDSDGITTLKATSTMLGDKNVTYNGWPISVNLSNTIESADVGSVRLSDPSGLRFQTTVSKAYLAELKADGYTVEAGTLIAPKATFETFDVTQTTAPTGTAGVDYLDVKASLEQPYNNGVSTITFAGSIVNIKTAHLDDDFTAIGYLKLTNGNTTEYVYSNKVTKNVSAVAQAAIASGKYTGTDLTTLQGLVAAAN